MKFSLTLLQGHCKQNEENSEEVESSSHLRNIVFPFFIVEYSPSYPYQI